MSDMGPVADPNNVKFEAVGICHNCVHRISTWRCKAFERIPNEILVGQVIHTRPYPGDKGVTFSRRMA